MGGGGVERRLYTPMLKSEQRNFEIFFMMGLDRLKNECYGKGLCFYSKN